MYRQDRGNGLEVKEHIFRLHMRRKFFPVGVLRHWIRLPREVLDFPSLKTPKTRLDEALSNLV